MHPGSYIASGFDIFVFGAWLCCSASWMAFRSGCIAGIIELATFMEAG